MLTKPKPKTTQAQIVNLKHKIQYFFNLKCDKFLAINDIFQKYYAAKQKDIQEQKIAGKRALTEWQIQCSQFKINQQIRKTFGDIINGMQNKIKGQDMEKAKLKLIQLQKSQKEEDIIINQKNIEVIIEKLKEVKIKYTTSKLPIQEIRQAFKLSNQQIDLTMNEKQIPGYIKKPTLKFLSVSSINQTNEKMFNIIARIHKLQRKIIVNNDYYWHCEINDHSGLMEAYIPYEDWICNGITIKMENCIKVQNHEQKTILIKPKSVMYVSLIASEINTKNTNKMLLSPQQIQQIRKRQQLFEYEQNLKKFPLKRFTDEIKTMNSFKFKVRSKTASWKDHYKYLNCILTDANCEVNAELPDLQFITQGSSIIITKPNFTTNEKLYKITISRQTSINLFHDNKQNKLMKIKDIAYGDYGFNLQCKILQIKDRKQSNSSLMKLGDQTGTIMGFWINDKFQQNDLIEIRNVGTQIHENKLQLCMLYGGKIVQPFIEIKQINLNNHRQ